MSDETENKVVPPPPPRPEEVLQTVDEKVASDSLAESASVVPEQSPLSAPAPSAPASAAEVPSEPAAVGASAAPVSDAGVPIDLTKPDEPFEMPEVTIPDGAVQSDGPSLMMDAPPKTRGGSMKILLLILLLAIVGVVVFFFMLSGGDAPKSRPLLPSPDEGRIERPSSPIVESVVEVFPEESVYVKQCRDHFNSSIAARGEDPKAYREQGDAYVESCAESLEAQAAGGAQ